MNGSRRTYGLLVVLLILLLVFGTSLPQWQFLIIIALAKGFAVLGLLLLLRTGLVSFGQALYYGLGAYTVGVLGQSFGVTDMLLVLLLAALVPTVVAAVLGVLMANYRDIFFAMLSLAFSMVLYGLLVSVAAFGSTDGFNVLPLSLFGQALHGQTALYVITGLLVFLASALLHHYFNTPLGRLSPAIRDNELRVEYMGASVRRAVYTKYVIAALLTGLGGGLAAMAAGHVDPEMTYWSTSGEFVFIVILSGIGSVVAPFLGALIFEIVRTLATQYSPNTWQLVLGAVLLLIIIFLPNGLWSLFNPRRKET